MSLLDNCTFIEQTWNFVFFNLRKSPKLWAEICQSLLSQLSLLVEVFTVTLPVKNKIVEHLTCTPDKNIEFQSAFFSSFRLILLFCLCLFVCGVSIYQSNLIFILFVYLSVFWSFVMFVSFTISRSLSTCLFYVAMYIMSLYLNYSLYLAL